MVDAELLDTFVPIDVAPDAPAFCADPFQSRAGDGAVGRIAATWIANSASETINASAMGGDGATPTGGGGGSGGMIVLDALSIAVPVLANGGTGAGGAKAPNGSDATSASTAAAGAIGVDGGTGGAGSVGLLTGDRGLTGTRGDGADSGRQRRRVSARELAAR